MSTREIDNPPVVLALVLALSKILRLGLVQFRMTRVLRSRLKLGEVRTTTSVGKGLAPDPDLDRK